MLKSAVLVAAVLSGIVTMATSQEPGTSAKTWPIVVVRLQYDGQTHAVMDATIVESPVPLKQRPAPATARIQYVVTDARGAVLSDGATEDPRILRAPLSPPGTPFEGHRTIVQATAEYFIRIPYTPEVRYLRFPAPSRASAQQEGRSAPAQVQVLDLAPFIVR